MSVSHFLRAEGHSKTADIAGVVEVDQALWDPSQRPALNPAILGLFASH